jgi:hypothetical protein
MSNATAGSWDLLDSGQLFSQMRLGHPPAVPGAVTMLADWAAVQSAVERLRDDIQTGQARLSADKSAVAAARARALQNTDALDRWQADREAAKERLHAARQEIRRVARADLHELISDYIHMQLDRSDSAALAADRVHVSIGQARMHGDVADAVARFENEKAAVRRALRCDRATIKSLLKSDREYSSAMEKLKSDRAAVRTTIRADRAVLHEAIAQLRRDETAAGLGTMHADHGDGHSEPFCG